MGTARVDSEGKQWMALCVYHEARGEPELGQLAVAHVILNRMKRRGRSARFIVLEPWQFSWANKGARPPVTDYEALVRALRIVDMAVDEQEKGLSMHGADHYFADTIDRPVWVGKMIFVEKIGRHLFYRS